VRSSETTLLISILVAFSHLIKKGKLNKSVKTGLGEKRSEDKWIICLEEGRGKGREEEGKGRGEQREGGKK
jgi:hypothetical protein